MVKSFLGPLVCLEYTYSADAFNRSIGVTLTPARASPPNRKTLLWRREWSLRLLKLQFQRLKRPFQQPFRQWKEAVSAFEMAASVVETADSVAKIAV